MKVCLDTDVLACAEGIHGAKRRNSVFALIRRLPQEMVVIPVQVMGELFNVLVRNAGRPKQSARDALLGWRDSFAYIETSPEIMLMAADLANDHQLGIWDSVILSAAAQSGCRLLLSEGLQDGLTWAGVTVVNPFRTPPHDMLVAALAGS